MALYDTPRNISSPDRINQIDSYIKRKSKANILNLESAKSDLRVGSELLNKRLNALNILSVGQESYGLINETIKELNKWIKENTFTDTNIKKLNKFANFILPFIDIQKDQTIQIYYNHGIEEILPMTHSCGSSELKPCGMCFNCKERIWAYNKLNKSLELGL